MADDDLFGFFNELKEVKPPAEEETGGGGGGGKDEGVQHIGRESPPGATGKRTREEEESEHNPNFANEIGPAMPPAHHPAFKKAKAVAAKPLLYDPSSIDPVDPPPQYQRKQQQQQAFAPPTSILAAPTKTMLAYDEQPPPSSNFPPSAPAPYQPYMAPYPSAAAAAPTATAAPPPQVSGAGVGTLFTVGAGAKPAVGGGGGGGRTGQQPAFGAARAASQAVGGGKPKKFIRVGPGETWEDPTLIEWPENDFRLFCGDLGPEVNDELLAKAFEGKYPSFAKAKVLREKQTGKSRGYGFVSFLNPFEGLKALREMNGRYIGSRPVKLKKCDWKERDLKEVRKKEKAKKKFLGKLGLG